MDDPDIEAHRSPRRRLELFCLALYPLAWVGLFFSSSIYWFLPAGLRLVALWLLPRWSWWKLAAVESLGILALSLGREGFVTLPGMVASSLLPWCVYALALRGIGRHGRNTGSRAALPRLLVVGALAAVLNALALTAIDLNEDGQLPAGLASMLVSYAVGDMAGIVIVLPVLLALRDQVGAARTSWWALLANGLVVAPALVALGFAALPVVEAPVYPMLLALLPMFGLAYRFGWRPGAIALGLLALSVHTMTGPLATLWGPGQLQLLITVAGVAALLLGLASETQRVQRIELSATVQALSLRGSQLSAAANRMASLQEQERRRIGAELHDQLGQDMTAIATRLRVVERTAVDHDRSDGLASIGLLVADAHTHLREIINHLHPAVLDRFGLARAISDGPFAEMLRDHDIHYSCVTQGNVDALPDSVASALYRICQEATTNCSRHGCGGSVHIHLALEPGPLDWAVTMRIEDDAGVIEPGPRGAGRGLLNIRDRAHAIGADYVFDAASGKPRHALQMRLAPLGPTDPSFDDA